MLKNAGESHGGQALRPGRTARNLPRLMRRPFACLLLLASLIQAHGARAQSPSLVLIDTATLAAKRLDESSGVVESRRRPGIFWTHNDSGDAAWLYTTDSLGSDLGRIFVRNARNVDWEDISFGRCPRSSGGCIYVGDIGDNNARRGSIRIYIIPEPDPPAAASDTLRVVDPEATIELRYPDHPHDAEALAIRDSTILLVTKDKFGPAVLFRASATGPAAQTPARVATLDMQTSLIRGRVATGAALSNSGLVFAVRTYVSLHLFSVDRGFAAITPPNGLTLPVIEAQGEGICFDRLGRIVLTSEEGVRKHAIISRIRLEGLAL